MRTKILRKQATLFLFQFFIYILFLSISLPAQVAKPLPQLSTSNTHTLQTSKQFASSKFTYKIIDAPNKTFGYDIYPDDRMMIHQPSAPGLPGNEGFKTKVDALKVCAISFSHW